MTDEPRRFCPGCDPEVDELTELVYVDYCQRHTPSWAGSEDELSRLHGPLPVEAGAGGADNRAACAFIHRGRSTVNADESI